MQPALFVSHGAPTLAAMDCPAADFLGHLGQVLDRPDGIIVISAHFEAPTPALTAAAAPEMIYDFRGFPEHLYTLAYPAPGAPDLAGKALGLLAGAGFAAAEDPARGYDHGTWVPLRLIYPEADIPVTQLSITMDRDPAWHVVLGRALAPLRHENILMIGSGSATHNLRAFFENRYPADAPAPDWVTRFSTWLDAAVESGDEAALTDVWTHAPEGRRNHPSLDHILPLHAAMGAGGAGWTGRRLHASTTYAVLAMNAYAFGEDAVVMRLAGRLQGTR